MFNARAVEKFAGIQIGSHFVFREVLRTTMKKSSAVVLVISGAMLAGCDSSNSTWRRNSQTYTNNHYVAGRGYYHAPYHAWFPLPYNYYDLSRQGYYHGGSYSSAPHVSTITASRPNATSASSAVRRGGFTGGRSPIS